MATSPVSTSSEWAPAGEFLDEQALADRLLRHIADGTTDVADSTWREPTRNYRDEHRFRDEIEVLRRVPTPLCPSAAIAEPGAHVARRVAGRELLAVRDRDGSVRVFKNSCRHRGAALAQGCGRSGTLACPYHGWVYRLDGGLRHVPGADGFTDLDREASGLVEVPSVEVGGFVVVDQDGGTDLSGFSLPHTPVHDTPTFLSFGSAVVEANWKVFLESFLEGYHIKSTHRETFFPFQYDNTNVVEHIGPHSRVTFPFRRIERLRDVAPAERRLSGLVTRVVHLFPTVVVAELSHHCVVVVLEPLDVASTRIDTFQLAAAGSGDGTDSKVSEATRRDLDFVQEGTREDQDMVRAVQRGLDSGIDGELQFGLFEGAVIHFHRNLGRLLAGEPG